MKSLGIDIGSSSVKVSLLDIASGECAASSANPATEMPIGSPQSGWAEQDPEMWWHYVCEGIRTIAAQGFAMSDVVSVGITYQMHGLVCLDKQGRPLRPSIIWCDSRAVEIGAEALEGIGREFCLAHTLNSPGNFTASKLAWVRRNEPGVFAQIYKFMLPGDYIAYRLSGRMSTSISGLSEQILWDFEEERRADFVAGWYGIPTEMIPEAGVSIGTEARTDEAAERLLGIPAGTPISYRAGDQPNNAFSLNVMEAGEVAATGGTSGVVYGVTDKRQADPQSRVNTFVHVNHTASNPRYGILLCINGTGIMNSWIRRNVTQETLDYAEMNRLAASVPAGSEGLSVVPFGNGAERMLCNRCPGAGIIGLDLNRHTTAHILRATRRRASPTLPLRHRHHARAGSAPRRHPRRRSKLVPLAAFPADALDAHGRPHRTVQYRRRAGRSPRRGAGRRLLQDARRSVRRDCAGWRSWNPPKLIERRWKKVTGHGSGK